MGWVLTTLVTQDVLFKAMVCKQEGPFGAHECDWHGSTHTSCI